MFDQKTEALKLTASGAAALMARFLGVNYKFVVLLFVLMIFDTLLGWLKAKKLGIWKSSQARWGFAGKIVELMLVALLYLLEWAFGVGFFVNTGLFYFMICEIASMAENIAEGKLNNNIPDEAVKLIEKLQYNVRTGMIKQAKATIEALIENENSNNEEDDNENS